MNLAFIMFLMDLFKRMGALPKTVYQLNGYSAYAPEKDKQCIDNIKQAEAKHYPKPDVLAYFDNAWTIGFGTVYVYADNNYSFKPLPKVVKGTTLSGLKKMFGLGNISDVEFSERLMKNHIYRKDVVNVFSLFKKIDDKGIPFNQTLAQALVDFYYNSGRVGNSSYETDFINDINKINYKLDFKTVNKQLAIAYFKFRCNYQSSVMSKTDWAKFKNGLIKRALFHTRRINGEFLLTYKMNDAQLPKLSQKQIYLKTNFGINF